MRLQDRLSRECLAADVAGERAFRIVRPFVLGQRASLSESTPADSALERSLAGMHEDMRFELADASEDVAADLAGERRPAACR